MAGAAEPGHGRAEQADGPGADDRNRIAGADVRVDADGVVSHAARLSERSFLQRQQVRNVMQAAGRNLDVAGHGAVHAVAEAEPLGIEVVQAAANVGRVGRQLRSGFAHHAVAFLEAGHTAASLGNRAGKLMAEDDGEVHLPALFAFVLVQVAAANGRGLHLQQHIVFANFGNGNFAQFHRVRLYRKVDKSNHEDCSDLRDRQGYLAPLLRCQF